jgi:hypothetical protein
MKGMTKGSAKAGDRRPWMLFRIAAWSVGALLLLLPLIAMRFTDEVNWTLGDFVFAGVLLLSVGVPLELAARRTGSAAYRLAVGMALAVWFLTIWLTGAVGIIGSEAHPANLLYLGVLGIGVVGSLAARFRPHGMSYVMVAAALALLALVLAVLVTGWGSEEPVWPWPVVILNGFFAALLVGAAALFRQAAREHPPEAALRVE